MGRIADALNSHSWDMQPGGRFVCRLCDMSSVLVARDLIECPSKRRLEELVIEDLEREGIK